MTVSNVRDRANNPNSILPNSPVSYQYNDVTKPILLAAQTTAENKVKITFSEPVEKVSAETKVNYTISNNIVVQSANLLADLVTVELTTKVHAEGNYTLTVSNVKDRAINPNTINAGSTANYTYVDITKPTILASSISQKNLVTVKFSEPVELA